MPESKFTPAQAEELAGAFARENVDYLFIGKSKEEYVRRKKT
jgi:hypothetical protein